MLTQAAQPLFWRFSHSTKSYYCCKKTYSCISGHNFATLLWSVMNADVLQGMQMQTYRLMSEIQDTTTIVPVFRPWLKQSFSMFKCLAGTDTPGFSIHILLGSSGKYKVVSSLKERPRLAFSESRILYAELNLMLAGTAVYPTYCNGSQSFQHKYGRAQKHLCSYSERVLLWPDARLTEGYDWARPHVFQKSCSAR